MLDGDVVYVPKRPGEPDCTFADITKITTMLGWKARGNSRAGRASNDERPSSLEGCAVVGSAIHRRRDKAWFDFLGRAENRGG